MQKRTIALPCAIPGTETTVTAFCYGPQDAQRHIYLQGSLHADEMPGSLVAYHLCQRLDKLEAQGALQARITVVPLCNTAGLRQSVLFSGVGRFDMAIGQNYNRLRTVPFYERVLARLQQNPQALGQDAQANRTTIRAAMRAEAQAWQPTNAIEALHSVLLQLACDAVRRRDALDEGASADLRALLGWPLDKDSLLVQAEQVSDEWQVLGVIQEERDNRLLERRVWLHGIHTDQRAWLLDHTVAGRLFESSWVALGTVQATLVFYPSAAPLRALVVSSQTSALPGQAAAQPLASTPEQEWQRLAQRVAANPWSHLHPLRCSAATLHYDAQAQEGHQFHLQWGDMALPLQLHTSDGWALLALSGGQPLTVQGEWDGASLRPLSALGPEGFWIWTPRA